MKTLLLLTLVVLAGGSTTTAQENSLRGRVVEDHSGTGLGGVTIRVSQSGLAGVLKETETDRSGEFTVTGLGPGNYQFAVVKSNYMPTELRITTQAGALPSPFIRLVRYGVIAGRVSPPSAARVFVVEQVPAGYAPRTFQATANAAGDYRLFGLPTGRYAVGTLSGHNSGQTRDVLLSGGEDHERIDLTNHPTQSFTVAGAVRSPEPVSSYLVGIVSPDRPSLILARRAVTGTFSFPNIAPGTYDALVSAGLPPGPQFYGRLRFSVVSQAVENLEVRVGPSRSAEFSVQSSECPQGATVTLSILEAWTAGAAVRVSAELAEGNAARFSGLFPGHYQASVRDPTGTCYGVADRMLDLSEASSATRSVALKPAPSIQGKVVATNLPADAWVILRDLEPGRDAPVQAVFVRTGDGFGFPNLPPGQYCLALHRNEESSERWAPESGCASYRMELSPGDVKELDFRN